MKAIISIICFTVLCAYSASSQTQTVSGQKNPQVKEVKETPPVPASQTATLVSGARVPVMTEVPVENKTESTEPKKEAISSERKPR